MRRQYVRDCCREWQMWQSFSSCAGVRGQRGKFCHQNIATGSTGRVGREKDNDDPLWLLYKLLSFVISISLLKELAAPGQIQQRRSLTYSRLWRDAFLITDKDPGS